jgi:hypothetical protein
MKQTEGLFRVSRLLGLLIFGAVALTLALGVVGYLVFIRSVDLPEARAIAERELRTGTLRFGEDIERAAHVYVRRPSDYFRAANGILAATDEPAGVRQRHPSGAGPRACLPGNLTRGRRES